MSIKPEIRKGIAVISALSVALGAVAVRGLDTDTKTTIQQFNVECTGDRYPYVVIAENPTVTVDGRARFDIGCLSNEDSKISKPQYVGNAKTLYDTDDKRGIVKNINRKNAVFATYIRESGFLFGIMDRQPSAEVTQPNKNRAYARIDIANIEAIQSVITTSEE